ncbi:MAG: PglZ domain-containing protein [Thermoproteota archaeon]
MTIPNQSSLKFPENALAYAGLSTLRNRLKKIIERKDKPLAILMVDALRYELSKELEIGLVKKGYEVEQIPMLSSLPSITEVGMASLLPHTSLTAIVEKGKLNIFLDQIDQKATREKLLKEKLGDKLLTLELNDILRLSPSFLKDKIEGYDYIIVMDRDIDIAGTYLLEVLPNIFQDLVMKLFNVIDRLHKAGLKTVIISTDHGFLLIPKDYVVNIIEKIKPAEDTDKKRRYAIGRPPYDPSLISFKFDQIGLEGGGIAAFPKGLLCLSMPGQVPLFLHGGISLQENCIAVITSKTKVEIGKVRVEAEIPEEITTAVFLINLVPSITPDANKTRVVKVEVYSNGTKIAESDPIELQRESKKARLMLKEIRPEAEIRITDVDTFEVLKSKKVKISIVGYAEEI